MNEGYVKTLRVKYEMADGEKRSQVLIFSEENLQDLQKRVEMALRVIAREKAELSADPEGCHEHIMLDRDKDGNVVLRPEGKTKA